MPPPPAPPLPPPPNGPVADLVGPDADAEPPSSSDQATDQMVASLDGGPGEGGTPIIPSLLNGSAPPPPPPVDSSTLPGFGNSALWQ